MTTAGEAEMPFPCLSAISNMNLALGHEMACLAMSLVTPKCLCASSSIGWWFPSVVHGPRDAPWVLSTPPTWTSAQ